ncbi:MAG: hypothetical protein AB8H79_11190 [Myxococcota bacterium]
MLWLALIGTSIAADVSDVQPGPHVMVVEVATRSKVPFAGTTDVVTRSLVKVGLSERDGVWTQSQDLCAVQIDGDSRATTVLPQAFIDAVPNQTYPIQLSPQGRYEADPGPTNLGFDPKITGGALPLKGSDPGVLDFDGDGHPGGTVVVKMPVFGKVKMYIAQAAWSRYHGTVRGGRIEGRVESVSVAQRTLGASISAFAANPKIEPVPEKSRFFLQRLSTDRPCSSLVASWSRTYTAP